MIFFKVEDVNYQLIEIILGLNKAETFERLSNLACLWPSCRQIQQIFLNKFTFIRIFLIFWQYSMFVLIYWYVQNAYIPKID